MIEKIKIDADNIAPKFIQIEKSILRGIEKGDIQIGEQLPSINSICQEFSISPGTVAKAYENLKNRGIIASHQGKGFYIASTAVERKRKIFLLFDRLNAYKEILYYNLIENLGNNSEVEVFFHHYNFSRFESLIKQAFGNYSHYVVMPHFNKDIIPVLKKIPSEKLYLLDNTVKGLKDKFSAVYQDFEKDVYSSLKYGLKRINKYQRINLVQSNSKFQFIPRGIIKGFNKFCEEYSLPHTLVKGFDLKRLHKNEVYVIFPDNELIASLKYIREKEWKLGNDIGIISYDDTPMKEILFGGITTISTDFKQMGETLSKLIVEEKTEQIANPAGLIVRESL